MSSKKKALFVATVDSHIELFHLPYLKMLKDAGYEIHVATNTDKPIDFCDKKIQLPIARSPLNPSNLKAIKKLKKVVDEEKYDIIHCHTPVGSVVARLAAKNARKNGTRVIYTAHGFHFYKGAPLLYWMIFYPVEKYLAKYTDTLITINQEDYERAKNKFGRRCNDIKYIPGVGIDENKMKKPLTEKEKQTLKKSLGLKTEDIAIIFPAELSKRKNQTWLITTLEAFLKQHNNIHLLLPGKDSLNKKCESLSAKLQLGNQVHFLGFRKDVPELMGISDIAISSAKQEGLPVNIMEAMHYGLPCVVTNCRGNRDLIKDGRGGKIIPVGEKDDLISAIKTLCENPELRKKYGEHNKNESQKYTLESIKKEYEKIYFRKKKIIYIRSTSIYNDSRAQKEIDALKKEYDVIVLGWDREQKHLSKTKNRDQYILFDKKAAYGSGVKNIINLLQFQKWIKKQLSKTPDISCIYACDFDTAYTAGKFAKKHHLKFIYDIYDYYIDCHNMPKILRNFIETKDIKTINSADLVIICSEERAKQISKASPQKTIVVHNSINLKNYELKKDFCQTPKNQKTKIAYAGILQDGRLLKEISQEIINDKIFELHIGGFGIYSEYFRNLAKTNDNVFFYGELKYPEVLSLEKDCDILFATYDPKIPNHKYSAPNKVYEAISLKKPIVVCKNTGVDKIVARNDLGTVINYDSKEFMEAIKNIHPTDRKNDIILNKYGWDTMEKRLLENIEKVLG